MLLKPLRDQTVCACRPDCGDHRQDVCGKSVRFALLRPSPQKSHPELRQMMKDGTIRLPPDRDYPGAGRDLALRLIAHAQRLGVLKLRV